MNERESPAFGLVPSNPWLAAQVELVRQAKDMSMGTQVPFEWVEQAVNSGGVVWDVGCGSGEKTLALSQTLRSKNITIFGLDVSDHFLNLARTNARLMDESQVQFVPVDITDHRAMSEMRVERPGVVVANGVFCSLVGNLFEKTLYQINSQLSDGGWLLVADCANTEAFVPGYATQMELMVRKRMAWFGSDAEEDEYSLWYNSWLGRYAHNSFIGIPWGTFVVMPPGKTNHDLEFFARTEELTGLIEQRKIERFARHYDFEEFEQTLSFFGFSLAAFEPRVWLTRSGNPLPGFVAAFHKVAHLPKVDAFLKYWFEQGVGELEPGDAYD